MKELLLTAIMIVFCTSASFSQAFGIGGVHRAGTSRIDKQKMVDKLTSELNLTDEQANTVVVIQQDYQLKVRSVKIDTQTTEKEKKEKLAPLEEERKQKLKKILTDEQINKVDDMIKDINRNRYQKQA